MRTMRNLVGLVALPLLAVGLLGCELLAMVPASQDVIEVELFNDSDQPVHILIDNEARAPSNRLAPGQARIVEVTWDSGGSMLVSIQNSLGLDFFGGCQFITAPFSTDPVRAGQVSYPGGLDFTCGGSAFQ